jgi:hypothetical protein
LGRVFTEPYRQLTFCKAALFRLGGKKSHHGLENSVLVPLAEIKYFSFVERLPI